jgi:hypothetical protein
MFNMPAHLSHAAQLGWKWPRDQSTIGRMLRAPGLPAPDHTLLPDRETTSVRSEANRPPQSDRAAPHAPNFSCHPTCATCALSLHLYGVEEKPICLTAPCHRALTALLLPTLSRHCVLMGCCLKTLEKIPSCAVSPPSHHPKVAAKYHPAAPMPSAIRLYEQLRGGSLPPATSDPTFTSMCSALEWRPSLTPPASWSLACAS